MLYKTIKVEGLESTQPLLSYRLYCCRNTGTCVFLLKKEIETVNYYYPHLLSLALFSDYFKFGCTWMMKFFTWSSTDVFHILGLESDKIYVPNQKTLNQAKLDFEKMPHKIKLSHQSLYYCRSGPQDVKQML